MLSARELLRERVDTAASFVRAGIVDQINSVTNDRSADATTVQLVRSIVSCADRLGLIWKLRQGTVSTTAADGTPRVILDGATQPIRCMSLLGSMAVGTRVVAILSPPSGCHVIGLSGLSGWKSITLLNSWTNRAGYQPFSYRVVSSPPNSVQIVGNMVVGTTTNGIQIGLMPLGIRPLSAVQLSCCGGFAATRTPKIEIDTAGVIKMWDFTNAGTVGVNANYPLNL